MYDRFKDPLHIKWAYEVKKRDNFECQICGVSGVYLHSHHCNSWDVFVNERFNIDNGITLCKKHHGDFHAMYGHGKNTEYQFKEFQQMYDVILKIACKLNNNI